MDLVSTAIPYVNASPHIGFALELVLADVIARHARDRWFIAGSDDNSLKNALAAEKAQQSTAAFVAEQVNEFRQLRELLNLSYDDFLNRREPLAENLGLLGMAQDADRNRR